MREINPQSEDRQIEDCQLEDSRAEGRLTEALRHLAASTRQGAPAEIGAGLVTAFRRHHIRRRRIRFAGMAAMAACLTLVAGLISMQAPHKSPGTEQAGTKANSVSGETQAGVAPTKVAVEPHTGSRIRPKVVNAKAVSSKAKTSRSASSRQFLALPGYDPAVPADQLHVVRVQLPASALWKMGAPVSADSGERKFLADFVVSQDGTPYAMRLVQ